MPCTCQIPEDQAQIFLRWDCCMFFSFWCEGVSEGNSIKSQDDQKGAWPLTPSLNLSIRSPQLVKKNPNFIAFHVFFYNNHFWTICVIWSKNGPLLFNLYHDPPERCLCFLLDLGFWHFFYPASKPRFMIYDVGYMICASAGSDVTVGSWKFLNSRHLSNFRCGRTEVDHLLGWGGGQF